MTEAKTTEFEKIKSKKNLIRGKGNEK